MNDYLDRMVIDGLDREAWLAAREGKIGSSNAASFAKLESAPLYMKAMLGHQWRGNAYARHGTARESFLLNAFHVPQNLALFHAEDNPRHVSTPDGIKVSAAGEVLLAEAKTTNKPFTKVPPNYMRQCQWHLRVMGAKRLLFIWELHAEFRPTGMEPESILVDRDEGMIANLIEIADEVLAGFDRYNNFKREMENA